MRRADAAYDGLWRFLVRFFKVPEAPPTLPAVQGEAEPQAFKPAPAFLKLLFLRFWIVAGLIMVPVLAIWLIALILDWRVGLISLPLLVLPMAAMVVFYWVAFNLQYDTTWYVMSGRSLRIRRGIWMIHEFTVTYENIQNIRIQQGPLERRFGLSNLVLESAGGGGGDKSQGLEPARPIIEGIVDAEALRAAIMGKLKQSRESGLGDEAQSAPQSTLKAAHVEVLKEILAELRAHRQAHSPN